MFCEGNFISPLGEQVALREYLRPSPLLSPHRDVLRANTKVELSVTMCCCPCLLRDPR